VTGGWMTGERQLPGFIDGTAATTNCIANLPDRTDSQSRSYRSTAKIVGRHPEMEHRHPEMEHRHPEMEHRHPEMEHHGSD